MDKIQQHHESIRARLAKLGLLWFVAICAAGGSLLASVETPKVKPTKHYVMVWDGDCIRSVNKTDRTRIEAPLDKDGQPILAQAVLIGAQADWNIYCGHFEPRD